MEVLYLSAEAAPWFKTGGLGDVASALPEALARLGHQVTVVTPLYGALLPGAPPPAPTGLRAAVELEGGPVVLGISAAQRGRVRWIFLDEPGLYGRAGIYGEGGADYPDNAVRFGVLSAGGLAAMRALGRRPDVVHANDWQTAPAMMLAKLAPVPPRTVFTIHNLAFKGLFPPDILRRLAWPASLFTPDGLEFFGDVAFIKAGLAYADILTTVSPTYAREITTPEMGGGLDGLLRKRDDVLHGILNGIDAEVWDPRTDRFLPARYGRGGKLSRRGGKARCKAALQEELGLRVAADRPLFAFVGRLTWQKGIDLLLALLDGPIRERAQIAILGTGEPDLEKALRARAAAQTSGLAVRIAFDEGLAHRMTAGADFLLMPSRFEPCGLNQMYALRYGTPPIVRATGGLADTVRDASPDLSSGTGFSFGPEEPAALRAAVERALAAFAKPDALRAMRERAMAEDNSWEVAAARFDRLYRGLAP